MQKEASKEDRPRSAFSSITSRGRGGEARKRLKSGSPPLRRPLTPDINLQVIHPVIVFSCSPTMGYGMERDDYDGGQLNASNAHPGI